jgi:hydroxymethylbilane synthase
LLDDPATRAAVIAERALLAGLEGGCAAPIGALAEVVDGETTAELWLRAVLLETDGSGATRLSASRVLIGDEGAQQADPAWSVTAESLGWALADEILAVRAEAQVLEADV